MTPEAYLDALLSLPALYRPLVSDDGRWAAWTWFRAGPSADVYAAPTDGSQPPVRLTDSADDTILLGFTPDSRAVLVEQDKDGNERSRVYRIDLEAPLTMIPLTEDDPPYYLRGAELLPDGRTLIFGANYDHTTGQMIEQTWLYRQDLATGERRPIAQPEKATWLIPEVSPQGTRVIYMRKDLHASGQQWWLVDVDGQHDREIINFGADIKAFASWCPDGEQLVVTEDTSTHQRVGVYTIATGALRWLIDDPARTIEAAFVPRTSTTGEIVVVEVRDARPRCSLLHPDTGAETTLPTLPGNLFLIAPVGEGGDWLANYYSAQHPVDLVRFHLPTLLADPDPRHFTSISRVWERTALTPADLTPAEDFRWRSVDGLDIQGWLYRAQQPRGTVVYVHGGPTAHSQDSINPQIQFYVRSGFNVLDPNYRGSTGFGLRFREAIREDGWGGREQDDIRAGIEALMAAGIAQPGKVGMTGTSYGGYSSWCGITRFPPEVLAASAPVCGMTDLVVDYETTRPDLRPYSEEMMGGTPAQIPEKYRERSPVHFVGNIKGRLLIVQGMQDPNVTPENVRAVAEALQAAGIEYGLLAFDDEGHGIIKPRNQKTLYLKLADFFSEAFQRP